MNKKVMNVMAGIGERVFREFTDRGGVVRDGGRVLSATEAASFSGAMPPLFWMLSEFLEEYGLDFPRVQYAACATALLGVEVIGFQFGPSPAPALYALADFLRNEIVPPHVPDLDLSLLFGNFKEWAVQNVKGMSAPLPVPNAA